MEFRWHMWRLNHYVWLAYLDWYNHPSVQSYQTWVRWKRYREQELLSGP
jgi:hypothetical protein